MHITIYRRTEWAVHDGVQYRVPTELYAKMKIGGNGVRTDTIIIKLGTDGHLSTVRNDDNWNNMFYHREIEEMAVVDAPDNDIAQLVANAKSGKTAYSIFGIPRPTYSDLEQAMNAAIKASNDAWHHDPNIPRVYWD